ncbi:ORF50 [Alcelaphine gammaherpesvirus 1]|nr:ORF50 [Alcelaphine gammaherpesvirus 1]QDY92282.1 protein Rta [Alcelaphine gammaherpesvirus 1]
MSANNPACASRDPPPKKRRLSRPICIDDFIDITADLGDTIGAALKSFQQNNACTQEQSEQFTREVYDVCKNILQENKFRNEMFGFVADMNLLNLFALFRSYKQRVRTHFGKQLLCATASSQIIRFFLERVIRHTDKWFLLAPCNGLILPQELAKEMYVLLSEARGKALNQGRMFSGGRQNMMNAAKKVLTVYSSLRDDGEISPEVKAYMAYIFPVPDIEQVFQPLFKLEQEIRKGKATLTQSLLFAPRKRCPNKTVFSQYGARQRYVLPEVLLEASEPQSTLAYGCPDISSLLRDSSSTQENTDEESGPCCSKTLSPGVPQPQSEYDPSPTSPPDSDTESCDSQVRPESTDSDTHAEDDDVPEAPQAASQIQPTTTQETQSCCSVYNPATTQTGFYYNQQSSDNFASRIDASATSTSYGYPGPVTNHGFSTSVFSHTVPTTATGQQQLHQNMYGGGQQTTTYGSYVGGYSDANGQSVGASTSYYTSKPATSRSSTALQWTTLFPPASSSASSSQVSDYFSGFPYFPGSSTVPQAFEPLAPSTPSLLDELLDRDSGLVSQQQAPAPPQNDQGGPPQYVPVAQEQQQSSTDPLSDEMRRIFEFFDSVNPVTRP